jgi:polysaccharide biosynthesis/export protein
VKLTKCLLGLLCACALTACASNFASEGFVPADEPTAVSSAALTRPGQVNGSARQVQSANLGGGSAARAKGSHLSRDAQGEESLAALFRKRTEGPVVQDYPIGPGDVLEVSVPPIDELSKVTEQVDADGTISLPMLGTLKAGGLTKQQLCAELRDKLKTYMYKPDVEVFVKRYNSREVAVVGAVNRPGLITLSAPNETVLDMLTSAGGITSSAADEVILLPAEYSSRSAAGRIAQVSAETPAPADGLRQGTEAAAPSRGALEHNEAGALIRQNSHPLIIPIKSSALAGSAGYLNMPVRPGDVLVVPGGGEVMVVGWVQHPGHFRVGSGLTVLGAIGAAGGPMYAADTADIHLVRTRRDGSKLVLRVNLSRIKDGTEADLPVRGNDVIDVPYSNLKIGPYVFYSILTRVGVGAPIPAP